MKWNRLTAVAGAVALLLAPLTPAFADVVSQAPSVMCQTTSTETGSQAREVSASVVVGDTVYFGGRFNQVIDTNGAVHTRNNLAACSMTTGRVLPWNPNMGAPSGPSYVFALVSDGSSIFAGGSFDTVGGVGVRGGLVRLPANPQIASPAPVDGWSTGGPGVTSSDSVKSLALSPDNSILYVGGTFSRANGVDRTALAAYRVSTTELLPWAPELLSETQASCPPDDPSCIVEAPRKIEVRALVARADKVIAAGYFRSRDAVDNQGHMAAFHPTTGGELAWAEKPTYPIIAMWGTATSPRIYTGGAGQGISKNTVYSIDPTTGTRKWAVYGDGNIQAIHYMNGIVYPAGHFYFIGPKDKVKAGNARWQDEFGGAASVDPATIDSAVGRKTIAAFVDGNNLPLAWNPTTNNAGNGVYSLSSSAVGLVAGGAFTRVAGAKQAGITKFAADFPVVSSANPAGVMPGAVNTPVTITGTKFAPTPTVGMGEGVTVLSVQYVAPTQITAYVSVASAAVLGARDVIVTNPDGVSGLCKGCVTISRTPPPGCPPNCPPPPAGMNGYRLVATDGGIFSYGDARFFGSTGDIALNQPIVGMSSTPSGQGYWLVAADGGIFSYGDARFYGSTGDIALNKPIVGMTSTLTGLGYWLVASDGGIFAFGDAAFWGSTGAIALNQPIVGMTSTPGGRGYWLVASDGGIFAFGDAGFYGSTGDIRLAKPITAMTATRSGKGYWMTATDGGIFAFGDATFLGSTGDQTLARPIVGMTTTRTGGGYWMVGADGAVFSFGDAPNLGSLAGQPLAKPIVGMAAL